MRVSARHVQCNAARCPVDRGAPLFHIRTVDAKRGATKRRPSPPSFQFSRIINKQLHIFRLVFMNLMPRDSHTANVFLGTQLTGFPLVLRYYSVVAFTRNKFAAQNNGAPASHNTVYTLLNCPSTTGILIWASALERCLYREHISCSRYFVSGEL